MLQILGNKETSYMHKLFWTYLWSLVFATMKEHGDATRTFQSLRPLTKPQEEIMVHMRIWVNYLSMNFGSLEEERKTTTKKNDLFYGYKNVFFNY